LSETTGERLPHTLERRIKDFTIYSKGDKDVAKEKKASYLARHRVNENWNDATSAGALSRWILWNLPTQEASIAEFKKRFNL